MADRLGIIADIHGNSWALEAVLEDLRDKAITRIVNLWAVSTHGGSCHHERIGCHPEPSPDAFGSQGR